MAKCAHPCDQEVEGVGEGGSRGWGRGFKILFYPSLSLLGSVDKKFNKFEKTCLLRKQFKILVKVGNDYRKSSVFVRPTKISKDLCKTST